MIRFAQPWAFALFLVIPPILYWMRRQAGQSTPKMVFSSVRLFGRRQGSVKIAMRPLPKLLSLAALTLLIVALARPQSPWREHRRKIEGIDIILTTDVSESMRALDFQPNRLEKAKQVMKEFVAGRADDQIGIVIFAKQTFALCPLTHDYAALQTFIDRIEFDLVDGQATAIGMGLANAVGKLRGSAAKSKVVILLTDGENNFGEIPPLLAADVAKQFGARVYTIGIGSKGRVQMPVRARSGRWAVQTVESNIDTETLHQIATVTGGRFFEATDAAKLEQIFKQIDRMERTSFQVNETHYFDELAHYLIAPALLLIGLALWLELTWLWSFP